MKNFLKLIIPHFFLDRYRKFLTRNRLREFVIYDEELFFKHSSIWTTDLQSKQIGIIVLLYHVIEKGLTMPDMKLGFGREKLIQLIDKCSDYAKKYDISNRQFKHAIGVIHEYKIIHLQKEYKLDGELTFKIDNLLNTIAEFPIVEQIKITKDEYFSKVDLSFNLFSNSRKSVRNFEGTVDLSNIFEAVELAQNTPSTCNRQPVRVHVVDDKIKLKKVLEIQKGNRGFGHLVDKAIVITSDLSIYQSAEERFTSYVDGGMYAMNLLYALHYYKVAACPLNWSKSPKEDIELRATIKIPSNEAIIVVIACGNLPDNFKFAASIRNSYQDIIKVH